MTNSHRMFAVLALCMLAPVAARGQDDTTKRPTAGQDPEWMKKWWSWTNDQRRQGGTIINPKGGDLNPALNDPAVRTWRDKNGWNVRPIVPQDLRSAIQMQEQVLGELKADILKQEKDVNKQIRDANADYFRAKDDFKAAEATKSALNLDKYNAEARWNVRNFNRCPEGNPWGQCSHAEEKQSWIDDANRELRPILAGIAKAEGKMDEAKGRMTESRTKLNQAKTTQQGLQDRVEGYIKLNNAQKRGEPFLFMPK